MLDKSFWDRVEKTTNCWNWTGALNTDGYGQIKIKQKYYQVHRLSYENSKGKIPVGLQIDHLCRNRKCVNPDHLEVVTIKENVMRSNGFPAQNSRKTRCPQGHEYSKENTGISKLHNFTARYCKACKRIKAYQNRHQILNLNN